MPSPARRFLLLGAAGQLGASLAVELACLGEVIPVPRTGLDVTDRAALLARTRTVHPDVIVNAAADNDVDGAETAPLRALGLNALALEGLVAAARSEGAVLVHFGSDFVFDGSKRSPYTEDDPPRPLGVYGASKRLGELVALSYPHAFVLRVESLFGGPRPKSTLDRMVDDLASGRTVRAFSDRWVSPTHAPDVGRALVALLSRGAPAGLYHCAGAGEATWLDVAREAARLLGVATAVVPVTSAEVPLRAPRPRYSALSSAKLREAGFEMPGWREALRECLAGRDLLRG